MRATQIISTKNLTSSLWKKRLEFKLLKAGIGHVAEAKEFAKEILASPVIKK